MRAEIAWRAGEGQMKGEAKARDIAQAETMPNAGSRIAANAQAASRLKDPTPIIERTRCRMSRTLRISAYRRIIGASHPHLHRASHQ